MTKIILHNEDLANDVKTANIVAIDSETMGLNIKRDRLCLIQLTFNDGITHLIKFKKGSQYNTPNLCKILENKKILKLFHFARFDIAALKYYLNANVNNIFCTKIASKLARTYTDKHGLKNLVLEFLNINLDKKEQSSNWGANELSESQKQYAANDVIYLHDIYFKIKKMLEIEGRLNLANDIFDFLETRTKLDLDGWENEDIFSH